MSTNFPAGLDDLQNPNPTDPLNSPAHSDQHTDENDAIEAMQSKIGIDDSEDVNSLDKKVALNTAHKDSDGSDHGFIDQDVTEEASPTFASVAVGHIDHDLTVTPEHAEGRSHWDDDIGTLELGLKGANYRLPIGFAQPMRAKNNSGVTIPKGAAVYINGASGQSPTMGLGNATIHRVANATIAVAAEEIANQQFGYYITAGRLDNVDTSWAIADGTPAFLSTTDGVLSNSLPTQPHSQVFVAIVVYKHATEGKLFIKIIPQPNLEELSNLLISSVTGDDVLTYDSVLEVWKNTNTLELDRLTIRGDNVVNRISYPLSGLSALQQTLNIVVDGSTIYMETEAVGGGDMPYVFDEEKHVLDCTTGAGTDGKAQIALTAGTVGNPQINYIYVVPNGLGVAHLEVSTSLPTGTFAWHSAVVLQDAVTVASDGPINIQRTTEALKHDGRGQFSYINEKLRALGARHQSGCASTLIDGVAMDLTVAVGKVFQKHLQDFPARSVVVDGITVANASGAGTLTENQVINDLNDIEELEDGTPIGINKYFSISHWATMASSDQVGNRSRLFANLPTGVYNSVSEAIADSDNKDVRTAPSEFQGTAFLVSRTVFKKTSGNHTPIGNGVYSLLGRPLGALGGGAGAIAIKEFSDADIKIYSAGEPTKEIDFLASGITAGNIRTIIMPDRDVDLGNVPTAKAYASIATTASSIIVGTEFDIFDEDNYATYTFDANVTAENITYTQADGRFTIGADGIYKIDLLALLNSFTTGLVTMRIKKNGTTMYDIARNAHASVDPVSISIPIILALSAGDYINITMQSATSAGANDGSTISINKI